MKRKHQSRLIVKKSTPIELFGLYKKNTGQFRSRLDNCCLTGFKLAQFFRQDLVFSSSVYSRDILYNYKYQASSPFDHSETVHLVSNAI